MKILVTGGAGFIGSNFVRNCLNEKLGFPNLSRVKVLDSLTYSGNLKNLDSVIDDSRLEVVVGSICNPELVDSVMADVDFVVHFAAESHVDRSIATANIFVQTNVSGTLTLLESAVKNKVKRFVHVSTDEVYGSIVEGSWDESAPLLPNSPYSASKASSDLIVRSFVKTHGLDAVITRCSNNYGPFQFPEKVIPLFATNLIQNLKMPIYGDGKNYRDWLHVDDHCRGIALALSGGNSGEVYNFGGGKELSNIELSEYIANYFGQRAHEMTDFVDDRKGHDFRYSVDHTKAHRELGYIPLIDFEEGIVDTLRWYESNRSWWEPLQANRQSN
jgi:dTDP-glucose 4,6-dehydratase